MTGALTLARGLWHRAGTSFVIFIVALCATAAATVGPTYYAAARSSILRDTFTTQQVIGRGYQATESGSVSGSLNALQSTMDDAVDSRLGAAAAARLFGPPVTAIETTAFFQNLSSNVPLAWRSGVCAHIRFAKGACPQARNDVAVSTSLAPLLHAQVGDVLRAPGRPALTVSGIYRAPAATDDYWFGRGTVYFPNEQPSADVPPFDVMFTPRSTIDSLNGHVQGTVVVTRVLDVPRVTPADVDALRTVSDRLPELPSIVQSQITVLTSIQNAVDDIHASWTALAVPVVVVTAELLALTWLLLFLVVTDAVEARGTEIALSKLRGYGTWRALFFGLGEPTTLLVLALPVGAVVGWLLSIALARVLLLPHTAVSLPGLGWVAAVIAAVGGIAAVVVAGRRTVVRPVVDQWRRTGRNATDRSWVFDAVVVTAAVAGLVQLAVTGTFNSASQSAVALLVPGLLGIAVAVVASRLLPLMCRAVFGWTRTKGGLGPFLAVRHIARRPGGTRTTTILATAIALATFSMCSWSVGTANRSRIAQATVGAPTVLSVALPPARDLAAAVDRIDPSGDHAAAVERFDNGTVVVTAVQLARFARVAHWSASDVRDPAHLLDRLHPPAPPPIVLDGSRVSLSMSGVRLRPARVVDVTLDVVATGATAPTPVDLGRLVAGPSRVVTGSLAGCPCVVRDLQLSPIGGRATTLGGRITLERISVGNGDKSASTDLTGWSTPGHWTDTIDQRGFVNAQPHQLNWRFFATKAGIPTLRVVDHPDPTPAVVSAAVAAPGTTIQADGLNAGPLPISSVATATAIPGALSRGAVVDLDYALRAASNNNVAASTEVWVRGNVDPIRRGLVAAGIPVIGVERSSGLADQFGRQGPGLASVLFLADAAAAAVLASLAAVLSLSAAARRRRYEYAALAATGASRRTLYAALAIEQLVVVGFGALVGVATGLLSVLLAGRSVPEFVRAPNSPLLSFTPSVLVVGLVLGVALVALLAIAATAAAALLRSVTPDELREAPV